MFSLFLFCFFSTSKTKYAVVVDCGSSGSRPFIYEYNDKNEFPEISYIDNKKFDIKLADAANDDSVIPDLVDGIYTFAKKKIDKDDREDTKIYFYATGGMRLLPEDQQEKILSDLKDELEKETKFIVKKKNLKVISGNDEGRFLWLSLNQLLTNFEGSDSVGALDYGGASAQIAFETKNPILSSSDEDYVNVAIKDRTYSLFSHSFLGLGLAEADKALKDALISKNKSEQTIVNPCYFEGYQENYNNKTIIGKTDYNKCNSLVQEVLIPSIKEITIPQYSKSINKFYAVGNFVDFAEFAGMPEDVHTSDILAYSKEVCKLTYDEALAKTTSDTPLFCYSGVFQYNMLTQGYGFTDEQFIVTKKIDKVKISWTLGALITDVYELDFSGSNTNKSKEANVNDKTTGITKANLISILIGGCAFIAIVVVVVTIIVLKRYHNKNQQQSLYETILS